MTQCGNTMNQNSNYFPEEARSINDPVWKYNDPKFKLLFFQDKLTTTQLPDLWKPNALKFELVYALRIYLRFRGFLSWIITWYDLVSGAGRDPDCVISHCGSIPGTVPKTQ